MSAHHTTPAERLTALGYTLPKPKAPVAAYLPVVRSGNLVFVSGQLPAGPDGLLTGVLGNNLDVAAGRKAAALAALNILAHMVHSAGVPLENISRIVKLTVLVASTPEFSDQHLVANGASELLAEVLGEAGQHARAAFGVTSLPLGAAVEIDAVIETGA